MNQGMIKKFLIALRNKLGVNPYIQRLGHFINYVISAENSEGYMDDLLKEDKTDSESIKKKLSSYRVRVFLYVIEIRPVWVVCRKA